MDRPCNACGVAKAVGDFKPDPTYTDGYRPTCLDCFRAQQRARHQRGKACPEYRARLKGARRRHDMKRKYGVTDAEYAALLAAQDGACWICKDAPPAGRLLAVDHCHGLGHVRGLLCHACNVGLGHFRDNPELLARAIAYLGTSPAVSAGER